jgi:hypothetical protein
MGEEKTEFRPRDRWLLFAFILGPMSALTCLTVAYGLVPTACAHGSKAMLHACTAVFFVLALSAAAIAWREFRSADEERARWFATVTMSLAISSAVMIVALEIPNWILRSCE